MVINIYGLLNVRKSIFCLLIGLVVFFTAPLFSVDITIRRGNVKTKGASTERLPIRVRMMANQAMKQGLFSKVKMYFPNQYKKKTRSKNQKVMNFLKYFTLEVIIFVIWYVLQSGRLGNIGEEFSAICLIIGITGLLFLLMPFIEIFSSDTLPLFSETLFTNKGLFFITREIYKPPLFVPFADIETVQENVSIFHSKYGTSKDSTYEIILKNEANSDNITLSSYNLGVDKDTLSSLVSSVRLELANIQKMKREKNTTKHDDTPIKEIEKATTEKEVSNLVLEDIHPRIAAIIERNKEKFSKVLDCYIYERTYYDSSFLETMSFIVFICSFIAQFFVLEGFIKSIGQLLRNGNQQVLPERNFWGIVALECTFVVSLFLVVKSIIRDINKKGLGAYVATDKGVLLAYSSGDKNEKDEDNKEQFISYMDIGSVEYSRILSTFVAENYHSQSSSWIIKLYLISGETIELKSFVENGYNNLTDTVLNAKFYDLYTHLKAQVYSQEGPIGSDTKEIST